jgi:hypothetical protein
MKLTERQVARKIFFGLRRLLLMFSVSTRGLWTVRDIINDYPRPIAQISQLFTTEHELCDILGRWLECPTYQK